MTDEEKQELIGNVLSGNVVVALLSESCFCELLDGLKRMYAARVLNCVDASTKWDMEWCALSAIFERICESCEARHKPPRNCDRFGGDIDKLREACLRERGLNPEEDFPDIFPDWLLAPSTAREGGGK